MNIKTTSVSWVRGIAEKLQAAGLDAYAVFAEAGVDLAEMNAQEGRYSTEKISMLWEVAAKHSGNSAIGLELAKEARPASFDIIAVVMMSSPTLQKGLECLVRYLRIISDAANVTLHDAPGGQELHFEINGGSYPVPRQRTDFIILMVLAFCRWLVGRELRPVVVEFAHPPPVDMQPYIDAFGCQINFDAPRHRVLFSSQDLSLPLPSSNAALAMLHERFASDYLLRLENNRISHKAREVIIHHLADGEPKRADVAKELCMSERTLHRRLNEEGTSFHKLVDGIRKELAEKYLITDQYTLGQTAYLLGFSDHSTFFRAFKRWFNMSPSEYRTRGMANTSGQMNYLDGTKQ